MTRRGKKGDLRNLIIAILLMTVGIETFLLFNPTQKKSLEKNFLSTQEKIKTIFPSEKKSKITPQPIPAARFLKPKPSFTETIKPPTAGRVAIILDDWGYHLESCQALEAIHPTIAVAIGP